MFLFPALLAAALLPTVASVCECFLTSQSLASQPQIYIVLPYESRTAQPCLKNCTISASSGDNSKGLTHFTMTHFQHPSNIHVSIDVKNSDGTYLIENITKATSTSDSFYNSVSRTPVVTIVITMTGTYTLNGSWNVAGTMDRSDSLHVSPTAAPTRGHQPLWEKN